MVYESHALFKLVVGYRWKSERGSVAEGGQWEKAARRVGIDPVEQYDVPSGDNDISQLTIEKRARFSFLSQSHLDQPECIYLRDFEFHSVVIFYTVLQSVSHKKMGHNHDENYRVFVINWNI